jgi:hypothetical protein
MMNFDLIIRVPGKKNALGETTYKQSQKKCYIKEELAIIYDALGKEVTSSMQLYVTGEDSLEIPANALLSVGHFITDATGDVNTDVGDNVEWPEDDLDSAMQVESEPYFEPLYEDRTIIKREVYYKPNGIADIGVFYLP